MKTTIIAEAGVNHNGSLEMAKEMVIAASTAGANFIKFQTFVAYKLVSSDTKQASYQMKNLGYETSQFEMLKKLELSFKDHLELNDCCKKHKIGFFSTAFDLDSIELLNKIGLPMWKIPSGEITNYPYLKKIGSYMKPVILSTGMSTLGDVEAAIDVLEKSGIKRDQISILHCTTDYPAPIDEVNLKAMVTLGEAFKVRFGYSDHTEGIEIPLAAVAMGASIIEKHFTLDRNMVGPDHKASLEPLGLKQMIQGIRKIEKALGTGIKSPSRGEQANILPARKSIVALEMIKKGEVFSGINLTTKRPGNGISPMLWEKIIGTQAKRDYKKDEQIEQ